ncbi:MAG TPA: hypothetical protein PKD75_07325 [Tepidiformaceae bacterium]|mgnify:CR=1 FL=1|nr:hypothetical protein [Tepidiformaceae bacterium]
MRTLCLLFPRLGIQIARREKPALQGRPVALISGDGDSGLISVVSVEAIAAGVETGMTPGQAAERCPAIVFERDNAGACLGELERMASILRVKATTDVAIVSRDALGVALGGLGGQFADETAAANALAQLARAWTGLDVRAGAGSTVEAALAAARTARRYPVVCPDDGSRQGLPVVPGEVSGFVRLRQGREWALAGALVERLALALEVYGLSFREVRIEVDRPSGTASMRIRSDAPLHGGTEALALIRGRAGAGALAGATALRVALGRVGPRVRVDPWRPAPMQSGHEPARWRPLQLAS